MTADPARIIDPSFWHQTLEDRMAEFAEIRELGAFLPIEVDNFLTEEVETFYAIPRFDEVVAVSKHPDDFCSSRGATSVFDLPTEMLEFFTGSSTWTTRATPTSAGSSPRRSRPPNWPACSIRSRRSAPR